MFFVGASFTVCLGIAMNTFAAGLSLLHNNVTPREEKKKKKTENVVITLLKCFWSWGQEEKSVDVLNVFLEINYGGVSSNSCAVLAYLNSR